MTFTLCHQFIEVRHSLAAGQRFAEHVLPALDAMIGIDTCVDVAVIFRLVDINMCTANTISFEELPEAQDGDQYVAVNPASTPIMQQHQSLSLLDDCVVTANADGTSGLPGADDLLDGSTHSTTNNNGSVTAAGKTEDAFNAWVVTRHGIVLDRLDSERLRLKKVARSAELAALAVDKFWRRLRRKVESESWRVALVCQWKLAVAHEVTCYCCLLSKIVWLIFCFVSGLLSSTTSSCSQATI